MPYSAKSMAAELRPYLREHNMMFVLPALPDMLRFLSTPSLRQTLLDAQTPPDSRSVRLISDLHQSGLAYSQRCVNAKGPDPAFIEEPLPVGSSLPLLDDGETTNSHHYYNRSINPRLTFTLAASLRTGQRILPARHPLPLSLYFLFATACRIMRHSNNFVRSVWPTSPSTRGWPTY